MKWIVQTALRFRVLVVASALLLLGLGQRLLPETPLDVFPEFAPPLVEIQTEAPGLSSEDVESLITMPIENGVIGTPWMTDIRSKSVLGLSSIRLIFDRDVDLMNARQLVRERLDQAARALPAVARPPVLLSPLSSTSRVLKIGLWSDRLSRSELSQIARWKIRPRLMAVEGVANVAIWGQRDPQLQVLVDPERLRTFGISLDRVIAAAGEASALGGGGFIDTPNQRLAIAFDRTVDTSADLEEMLLESGGGAVLTLGDVADVVEGVGPPIGDAIVNDVPGILLIVEKQPWGNTLQVTHEVERVLDALRPALDGVEMDATIFRPATFVEMSLANLRTALLIGAVLVAAILGLFLYEWRTALISMLAMPLSLVAAALAIRYQGGTIDTMVLAGLIIALGEVVDDAIIDVENVLRRLRLERDRVDPRSPFEVVLSASLEVRSAVLYASLIVAVVLVPVFLLPGLSGAFFRPLALSYILAILASLAVALTVTPALCLLLLPGALDGAREAPVTTWLRKGYQRVLPRVMRPRASVAVIAGSCAAALAVWPLVSQEFLPNFKEYDFLMHWVEKPSVGIEAMDRITIRVSRELRAVPGVRNFGSHIGRAEAADEVVGTEFTELWISLEPDVDYESTVANVQEIVDGYPGLHRDLLTYLRERIKEVLTGASASVVVRLYGDDLGELRSAAADAREAMSKVEGVSHLAIEHQTTIPQIGLRVRPEAAARHGVSVSSLQRTVETLVRGRRVGQIFEDQTIRDIVVWGEPSTRSDPVALGEMLIEGRGGSRVPLKYLADIDIRPAANSIKRNRGSRRIDVICNSEGRPLSDVAEDVEARVRALSFAPGIHPEFLGELAERRAASQSLALLSMIALLGVYALLQADFGSFRLASVVFLSLPFALVGGVASVVATGGVLSLGSLVGFVTVFGIAARNALMLMSHSLHLEKVEEMPFGPDLVMRAAEERLAPILMTALTTGLALVPIVARGAQPGYEIEHPMALVILGGLITSTILNLFLMPGLILRWGRAGGTREARSGGASPTGAEFSRG